MSDSGGTALWPVSETGVWPARQANSDETAERLLEILSSVSDWTADSDELRARISSWEDGPFLGSDILNPLRPVRHLLSGRVLDLTASYGNVARYIAEGNSATVVVAAGFTPGQPAVVASRCRDLDNVVVVQEQAPLKSFVGSFDTIVARGILHDFPGGFDLFLSWCSTVLNPTGNLILLIDNRLGLRRFATQVAVPTEPQSAVELGHREVEIGLSEAGFLRRWSFSLFPNARAVRLIATPALFARAATEVGSLLYTFGSSFDPESGYTRPYPEALLWQTLLQNGLADKLSNAYMVIASRNPAAEPPVPETTLAYLYTPNRLRHCQKESIVETADDCTRIRRRRLYPSVPPRNHPYAQCLESEPYQQGRLYSQRLAAITARPGWTLEEVVSWVGGYAEFLRAHLTNSSDGNPVLPANFVDCSPMNLIETGGGLLHAFDLEWIASEPPALDFVCFRGLLYAFASLVEVACPLQPYDLRMLSLVRTVMGEVGIPFTGDDLDRFFTLESEFQAWVVGEHVQLDRDYWATTSLAVRGQDAMRSLGPAMSSKPALAPHVAGELTSLRADIDRTASALLTLYRSSSESLAGLRTNFAKTMEEAQSRASQLADQQKTIAELEARAEALASEVQTAGSWIADLQSAVSGRSTEVAALQTELADRERTTAELRSQVAQLEDLGSELRSGNAALQADWQDLQNNLAVRNAEVAALQTELADRERTTAELRSQVAQLEDLGSELRSGNAALQADWQDLQNNLAERNAEVAALQTELADSERTLRELRRQIRRLESLNADLQTEVGEVWARLDQSEVHTTQLVDRLGQLRSESESRQARINELETRNTALQANLDHQTRKSGELQARLLQMEEAAQVNAGELKQLTATNQELRHHTNELEGQLRQIENAAQMKAGETQQLRAANQELGNHVSALADEAAKRSSAMNGLTAEVRAFQQALAVKNRDIAELRHEAWALRRSLSWRVTAPLRGLYDLAIAAVVRSASVARHLLTVLSAHHREGVRRLRESGLFDPDYYRSRYPDVARSPMDPLQHFYWMGEIEGRWPNPLFDPELYKRENPDCGSRPVSHYRDVGDHRGSRPHVLFDPEFYRASCPEACTSGLTALAYYLEHDASSPRSPHPLFDPSYYLSGRPRAGKPALVEYFQSDGLKDPHPLFDSAYYSRLYPQFAVSCANPLLHYVTDGTENDPHWLFNTTHYRHRVTVPAGQTALEHYLRQETGQRISPHPAFDIGFYLNRNPELLASGIDPLGHYATEGFRSGKQPNALFDPAYYLARRPAAKSLPVPPLRDFLEHGAALGCDPHPLFVTSHYISQSPGMPPGLAWLDFLQHGRDTRLNPHPLFDSEYYVATYPDVAGQNPLAHYLLCGASEGRKPHPLFDTAFYVHHHGGELFGANPLVHYTLHASIFYSPHPLFDTAFYLQQRPDVRVASIGPLVHYLLCSGGESTDPHPLFDTSFYRMQVPDIGSACPLLHYISGGWRSANPNLLFDTRFYCSRDPEVLSGNVPALQHYLEHWSDPDTDPHPLFDTSFYLDQKPLLHGESPLAHYRRTPPPKSADPHPLFDTDFYISQAPEIRDGRQSPLEHYLSKGAAAGLQPNSRIRLDPLESDENPLLSYVLSLTSATAATAVHPVSSDALVFRMAKMTGGRASALTPGEQVILYITHLTFYPPRAGNETRAFHLVRHLESQGYRVIVLVNPLEPPSEERLHTMAEAIPDLIICPYDGLVNYQLRAGERALSGLDGLPILPIPPEILGESVAATEREIGMRQIDRAFSHDALCRLVLHLHEAYRPCVVMANYVFTTRFLPLISADCLRVIDTIDVFSTKAEKVVKFGVDDGLVLSRQEERKRLLRSDMVIAIQDEERNEFGKIVPERSAITVGVDFSVDQSSPIPEPDTILFLGSGNPMNVKGLNDLLQFAWPLIAKENPKAKLLVAGRVCDSAFPTDDRVLFLGPVSDVSALYARVKVVLNPVIAGTGLKIKTVEALCHLRPVVGWPNAFEGLDRRVRELCIVAEDWFDFAAHVNRVLRDPRPHWFSQDERRLIASSLSPSAAYSELDRVLHAFFEDGRDAAVRSAK